MDAKLKLTKGGQKSLSNCFTFERFSFSRHINIDLTAAEVGVLVVFGVKQKDDDEDQISTLTPESSFVFSHLSIPKIAGGNQNQSCLLIRINVQCLQRMLSTIKYSPLGNRQFYEALNSFAMPSCRETNILLSSLDLYSKLPTLESSEVLFESKLLELLWLLNLKAKTNFDRFVSPFLIPKRSFLDAVINKYYKENLSVEQLAGLAGFSVSTFKRKFDEAYKCSPKRWIQEKRLNEAKTLLEFSDRSISEIGYEVGFENISHFIQSFKTKFGITPKALKESFLQKRQSLDQYSIAS
ncbi:AraC family transcriptional regulator [Chryseotalea sanaruensis]|uniref:AraC family transcriptional regulator n=2 Tax=Chryseotalea sanaruensis TaxID=2482724 RepID=A0A401UEW4_9BACT|nr:AraC family transcriptional regulator [Chryseotalea sanaruensis]